MMPETTSPMTLAINVTIDVNARGWTRDYGIVGDAEIREDVQSLLVEVLGSCNENITLPQPYATTVTPTSNSEPLPPELDATAAAAPESLQLDALLDAAAKAGYANIVLRPGETPIVVNEDHSLGVVPGFAEPLDGDALADQLRLIVTAQHLPPNFFGTFTYSRPGVDFQAFADTNMAHFRRIPAPTTSPAATAAADGSTPLTHIIDRQSNSIGNQHWDNALYTFSDGQTWEIITEWTQDATGPTAKTATETSVWVDGIPMEAQRADFLAKLAQSTEIPKNT
jgi:hypothetical protein